MHERPTLNAQHATSNFQRRAAWDGRRCRFTSIIPYSLSGQSFWSGATLASLGATPGNYQWRTSYGGVNDTITLNTLAVPEPHEYAMLAGLGLIGFAGLRRWPNRA